MATYGFDGIDQLDETSADLAHALLHGNPVLARFARSEAAPGGGRYFVLEVPSPSGEHGPLLVDTGDRDRVAVRWGRFSAEFDAPPGSGRASELPAAIDLIEDVLAGTCRVFACERDGRFSGCGVVMRESELRRVLTTQPRGTEVTVLHWDRAPAFYVASGAAR
ncbi:hypothetical protein Pla163_07290 [Planctomycetes bacterium Pla163]|uniref:Uncharacterized protein n=1 Tax=Rohdeia mirabilis TaxID=2528008 RepID=A0A518CWN5_9BACT|nr:hypothetical protein Pla163_07290 [Planctomycetes bacterium Pla163]